jgi:hypothetical protein
MTPVSEIMEDRDAQIAKLIRREIDATEARRQACGYPLGSMGDNSFACEIYGMRRILALIDPNPHC